MLLNVNCVYIKDICKSIAQCQPVYLGTCIRADTLLYNMRFRFNQAIPSKKNSYQISKNAYGKRHLRKNDDSRKFEKNFIYYFNKNYKAIFTKALEDLPKPWLMALHITKYRNDDFDIDNKITTVQDALFKALNMADTAKTVKFHPGTITIDKTSLDSPNNDFFEIELLQSVQLNPYEI